MRYGEQELSTGTGFIVEKNGSYFLFTNRHNVTGRHQITGQPLSPTGGLPNNIIVMQNVKDQLGSWAVKTEALFIEEQAPRWKEHPTLGPDADFVALPLSDTNGVAFFPYNPLNPGPSVSLNPSDIVSVVGFPFGLTGGGALAIWATGFIASEIDLADSSTFLIDCRSRPGQSGSAVIAYRSGGGVAMADGSSAFFDGPVTRFLGIYSGRVNDQSDLGIVWKASAISQLVEAL